MHKVIYDKQQLATTVLQPVARGHEQFTVTTTWEEVHPGYRNSTGWQRDYLMYTASCIHNLRCSIAVRSITGRLAAETYLTSYDKEYDALELYERALACALEIERRILVEEALK